jgi:hypothetical protein
VDTARVTAPADFQFKSFEGSNGAWDSLCEAILRFDLSDLSIDKIDALSDMMPTAAEMKKARTHARAPLSSLTVAVGRSPDSKERSQTCAKQSSSC